MEAGAGQALVLTRDGQPFSVIGEGRLRVWAGSRWATRVVDLRLQTMELAAQDLLSADQVAVRVKPVVS